MNHIMKIFWSVLFIFLLFSCATPGALDLQVKEYKEAKKSNKPDAVDKSVAILYSDIQKICQNGSFGQDQFSKSAGLADALLVLGSHYHAKYDESKATDSKKMFLKKAIENYERAIAIDRADFYIGLEASKKEEGEKKKKYFYLFALAERRNVLRGDERRAFGKSD